LLRVAVVKRTGKFVEVVFPQPVIGRPKAATQWRLKSSHFEGV
jgi:hypothetical protein